MGQLGLLLMPGNLCPWPSSVTPGKTLGSEDWVQILKLSLAEWPREIRLTLLTLYFPILKWLCKHLACFVGLLQESSWKRMNVKVLIKPERFSEFIVESYQVKSCLIYLFNLVFFFLCVCFPWSHHCPLLFNNVNVDPFLYNALL